MMRCEVFTDPLYNGERFVEFDPDDVVAVEERSVALLLRPRRRVTVVTLGNGDKHTLRGERAAHIKAAQTPRSHPQPKQ